MPSNPEPTQPLTGDDESLIREWHNKTRDPKLGRVLAEVDRLRAENTALRASLDQFRSFPTEPGPGEWSTGFRMGYADAGRDVRALARALGVGDSGEPTDG
jgi:hypothetical protein